MKKVVLKLELHDDKAKQKAMKSVSRISGVDSIAMDMKDKKMTVIGDTDVVEIVTKLRKFWHTKILTVGPAKEAEKRKEEPKKVEVKKIDGKYKDPNQQISDLIKAYNSYYNPYMNQPIASLDENSNFCVIC